MNNMNNPFANNMGNFNMNSMSNMNSPFGGNGFNMNGMNMNMNGMNGMMFNIKSVSTPVNIGILSNPTQYVIQGKQITDTIQINSENELSLILSGEFTFSLKPELILTNNVANVIISGDISLNQNYNQSKTITIYFNCYENGNTEVSLTLSFNYNEKLTFKIQKQCTYTFLDSVFNVLNWIYRIMLCVLISIFIYTFYLIYKEGNINILKQCFKSTLIMFSKSDSDSSSVNKLNNNNQINMSNKEDVYDEEKCFTGDCQNRFKQMQKEAELNPKFYETSQGLIYSKKVKVDYDNYGGCN